MRKEPIKLQDLRRKIYIKAKAEQEWRFWGIYVHVCKLETLEEAYTQAKRNNGEAGVDGVTFEEIEQSGLQQFLISIQSELQAKTYSPTKRKVTAIPKEGGKTRKLSIPTIKRPCGGRSAKTHFRTHI